MTIRAGCTNCGAILKADDRHAGRTVACPKCQSPVVLSESPAVDVPLDPFAEEAEATWNPPPRPAGRVRKPEVEKAPQADPPATSRRSRREQAPEPIPTDTPAEDSIAEDTYVEELSAESEGTGPDDSFPDLTEEELAGQPISPRRKKRKQLDPEPERPEPERSPRRSRRGQMAVSGSSWRDYLHWVLFLALIPLGISTVMGDGPDLIQRLNDSLQNHPEVNEAGVDAADSPHDWAMLFPDHRLDGAFLPADTYLHWVFALLSAGLFLVLFLFMWPSAETRSGPLLASGVTTGTIGIMLLLGFQWIAFHTWGVALGGRGMGRLIFLIVKFIAFSYKCALETENGFTSSFFGFTFGVGLCEELCKALPVAFYVSGSPKRDFRTICLMGLASGVGFGVSEGITYSSDYYNGLTDGWIYLIRFASCVSLHAIWAGSVAILIYREDDYLEWSWEAGFWFMVKYLLMAMILHGLYDTLLKKDYEILAFLTAIGSFLWFQWLLSRTAAET